MLPPRTVYSLAIRNHSSKQATVQVTYTDADDNVKQVSIVVAANGSATAQAKSYAKGSAYYAMEITKVAIVDATVQGDASSLSAPFPGVDSPTKSYPIEIVSKNGALALVAKYGE